MGTWLDNDGRYRKYGTTKAVPVTGGDYLQYGDSREIEIEIDLTTLTASPVIQNDQIQFPTNVIVESVTVVSTTSATGGTSFSVGTVKHDRTTGISNTAFLNAAPIVDHTTAGQQKLYTTGVTGAGGAIGTTIGSDPAYITALAAGTYTAGKVKVRIKYRGNPPITQ